MLFIKMVVRVLESRGIFRVGSVPFREIACPPESDWTGSPGAI